jgi:hypothetical protein
MSEKDEEEIINYYSSKHSLYKCQKKMLGKIQGFISKCPVENTKNLAFMR